MKGLLLVTLLGGAAYWEYKRKMGAGKGAGMVTKKNKTRPVGSVSTLSRGFHNQGALSSLGSRSPGSGVPVAQPPLSSTWAVGSDFGAGFVAPNWDVSQ